jgi:MFS family permease
MLELEKKAATGPTTNQMVLFWASFMTLIAAGIGFSIRGNILDSWGSQFGFTQTDLGQITGAGLWGFPITIIALSFVADRIGYAPLMVLAFLLHFLSGVITLAATWVFTAYGKDSAYQCLYWGTFTFALANGTCEAVINPLTATLFPRNKTHWLNILHAGWPGGLVLGALFGVVFEKVGGIRWEIQLGMFLIPVIIYGVMMIGRRFPHSETRTAGVSLGTMLLEFASPILISLVILQAMVGYVELGTDSWIINITKRVLDNPTLALAAFIWTNVLMFTLRFFAGPIVHRISPVGLLFVSAVLGATGLTLLGRSNTALAWIGAVTVYGLGKTFFWPTMLGVVSERFPRGGALTLGVVGGIGMLSAGLLGGPGIGYKQDYFATKELKAKDEPAYERYSSGEENGFLFFPKVVGLDNSKLKVMGDNGKALGEDLKIKPDDKNLQQLNSWWQNAKDYANSDRKQVEPATLHGGQEALSYTAAVPACMAVGYLLLLLYFKARGGYKAEVLAGHAAEDEEFTGGTPGPGEG